MMGLAFVRLSGWVGGHCLVLGEWTEGVVTEFFGYDIF